MPSAPCSYDKPYFRFFTAIQLIGMVLSCLIILLGVLAVTNANPCTKGNKSCSQCDGFVSRGATSVGVLQHAALVGGHGRRRRSFMCLTMKAGPLVDLTRHVLPTVRTQITTFLVPDGSGTLDLATRGKSCNVSVVLASQGPLVLARRSFAKACASSPSARSLVPLPPSMWSPLTCGPGLRSCAPPSGDLQRNEPVISDQHLARFSTAAAAAWYTRSLRVERSRCESGRSGTPLRARTSDRTARQRR